MSVTRNICSNSIWYSDDSTESYEAAFKEFKEMRDSGEYENIRLVESHNFFTEGWWIEWGEVARKSLHIHDYKISK